MNYMNKMVSEATSEELLHALISANGLGAAPRKTMRCEPASSCLIEIGQDTSAEIVIFDDDINLLNDRIFEIEEND